MTRFVFVPLVLSCRFQSAFFLKLFFLLCFSVSAQNQLILIATPNYAHKQQLEALHIKSYWQFSDAVLAGLSENELSDINARNFSSKVLSKDFKTQSSYYLLFNGNDFVSDLLQKAMVIHDNTWLISISGMQAQDLKEKGYNLFPLPTEPVPLRVAGAHPRIPVAYDPFIQTLIDGISSDTLTARISRLEKFVSRNSASDSCRKAEEYIYNYLKQLKLDSVVYDPYTYQGYTARNVIGTQTGTEKPDSVIVVCGHLDAMGGSVNVAPGADDNGSGTAGTMEIARILSQYKSRWTIKYCLFPGEEQWMIGSGDWVTKTAVPAKMKIFGCYNIDMVGYAAYQNKNLMWVVPNSSSVVLSDLANDIIKEYTINLTLNDDVDGQAAGDHTPFWQNGYRAVFVIEAAEKDIWAGTANPNYHKSSDLLKNMDMTLVRRAVQMVTGCVATVAGVKENTSINSIEQKQHPGYPLKITKLSQGNGYLFSLLSKTLHTAALDIFNAHGQSVITVFIGGDTFFWDGTDNCHNTVASGVYFVRLRTGNSMFNARVVVE